MMVTYMISPFLKIFSLNLTSLLFGFMLIPAFVDSKNT
ncbi:hypothetical protein SAMN00120144_1059 [Hymenobacter roseosalivarius DSM 11622]|uniref:Uncharacterized protein n=1 Tax=Hymenobacter roseosalivarius DSM 11622 TaxID=645990 RepID=A0A1W1VZQ2_9BACT|nr:hypothetical protein SAMN00120144_1059 [Hymenobacter roseosalivarius DSM 11622]